MGSGCERPRGLGGCVGPRGWSAGSSCIPLALYSCCLRLVVYKGAGFSFGLLLSYRVGFNRLQALRSKSKSSLFGGNECPHVLHGLTGPARLGSAPLLLGHST